MLFKIPFIIFQVVWFHVTCTPPHGAAPPKEQVKHRHWLEPYHNVVVAFGGMLVLRVLAWVAAIAEIAVLLANQHPSHPVSSIILTNLIYPAGSKDPNTIGLTLPAVTGCVLITAGGMLRRWCYRSLDRLFTFELSMRPKHTLVTTGPYVYVRHPSYTGGLLAFVGGLFVIFGHGGWVRECGVLGTVAGKIAVAMWIVILGFIVTLAIFYRVWTEDRMLKDMFGKEWDSWAEKVRWKLIPGVF